MQRDQATALSNCKTVFARSLTALPATEGFAVFNAPRPLMGKPLAYDEWCHGRFYSEVDPSDSIAHLLIQGNIDLDARLVVRVSDQEVVDMLLVGNKYAAKYREFGFDEQLEMLLPNLSKIQSLPYPQAMELLNSVRTAH